MSGEYKGHEAIFKCDDEPMLLVLQKNSPITGQVLIIDRLKLAEHEDLILMTQNIH